MHAASPRVDVDAKVALVGGWLRHRRGDKRAFNKKYTQQRRIGHIGRVPVQKVLVQLEPPAYNTKTTRTKLI